MSTRFPDPRPASPAPAGWDVAETSTEDDTPAPKRRPSAEALALTEQWWAAHGGRAARLGYDRSEVEAFFDLTFRKAVAYFLEVPK